MHVLTSEVVLLLFFLDLFNIYNFFVKLNDQRINETKKKKNNHNYLLSKKSGLHASLIGKFNWLHKCKCSFYRCAVFCPRPLPTQSTASHATFSVEIGSGRRFFVNVRKTKLPKKHL